MLPCPPLKALIKGRLRSLLQLLVPFMRVTEAQARTWREDPNEFLAHEEDERVRGCAVRLSGEYLLGEPPMCLARPPHSPLHPPPLPEHLTHYVSSSSCGGGLPLMPGCLPSFCCASSHGDGSRTALRSL